MRIRTFIADTIGQAMANALEELGEDAVIISTREGKRGQRCEVRAAVEAPTEPVSGSPFQVQDKLRTKLFADMESELKGLKDLRNEMRGSEEHGPSYSEVDLVAVLKYHRFTPEAAKTLFHAAKSSNKPHLGSALGSALVAALPSEPLPLGAQRPIMLVGPSGAGKTVTAAKLIARSLTRGGQVACLSTDTLKAGAIAQLTHFCDLMGQKLSVCETPDDLQRNVAAGSAIIDSPGVNPYRETEIRDLAKFVEAAQAEPVLVIPAGQDAEELTEIAAAFKRLGISRAIFTRLDAAQRLGGVFSAAVSNGLALAHVSASPYVADGFRPFTHNELGGLLADIPSPDQSNVSKERAAS